MNFCQMVVRILAIGVLFLMATSWAATAEEVAGGYRLTDRSLESLRQHGLPSEAIERLTVLSGQRFDTPDAYLKAVRERMGDDLTDRFRAPLLHFAADDITAVKLAIGDLAQRVKALEAEKSAREDATRSILRDALSTVGSNINEAISLGGTLEMLGGWSRDFDNQSSGSVKLNTAELGFDLRMNDWTTGNFTLEWDDGSGNTFPTTSGRETGVERINIDTAEVSIGDAQRFPPVLTLGRIVLPFGISTGSALGDVLTIEDPLTVDIFKIRRTAIGFSLGLPTPTPVPAVPPVTPPPVRPLVLKPMFSALFRGVGYKPYARPPALPSPVTPPMAAPPFHIGVYTFDGKTFDAHDTGGFRPDEHFGATVGFTTSGSCGRAFDQLAGSLLCPWGIDVDVDYVSSVFDSRFLADEYQDYLGQIGFVPGMAASMKATVGPVSIVGEWNGALERAAFTDDAGDRIDIRPSAWQVTVGYQFDWNPWVTTIGGQGNFLALGYSESRDMAGATRIFNSESSRIGFVPRRRYAISVGEWVLDNLRVAVEYTYNEDYAQSAGGTGNSAEAIFSSITVQW